MDSKVKYWMELASEDIDVAEVLLDGGKRLYAGFMCHLAIEKALKAKIESIGETPLKIHNLVRLANLGKVYNLMSPEKRSFIASLGPLNIEARYPQSKSAIAAAITNDVCAKLITDAKEFVQWIETQL